MEKEIIEKLIDTLSTARAGVMEQYVAVLTQYDIASGSVSGADWAGRIHDLDRHITNLHLELRRMSAEKVVANV